MQTIEEWRILRAMGLPGPTRPGRTHTFHEPEWPNLGRFWHHSSGTLKVSVRLPHVLLRCNVVDYDVGRSILRWSLTRFPPSRNHFTERKWSIWGGVRPCVTLANVTRFRSRLVVSIRWNNSVPSLKQCHARQRDQIQVAIGGFNPMKKNGAPSLNKCHAHQSR